MSPGLARGALVINQFPAGMSKTLRFQYNPESVRRSLRPQTVGGGAGEKSAYMVFSGAPVESIELELFLDQSDKLTTDPEVQDGLGLLPQLDAFETILYPGSPKVVANTVMMMVGVVEILPYHAPSIQLILGRDRTMPVRIMGYQVTEELLNRAMNPIRARISLSVEVVTYSDISKLHPDYPRFMRYQVEKELRSMGAYERIGVSAFGFNIF